MKDVVRTDYSKVDSWTHNNGYTYRKYAETEHFIIWKARNESNPNWKPAWDKYEIWKKHYIKNPDGSMVVSKVGDEQMGRYGWFCNDGTDALKFSKRKMDDGDETWGEVVAVLAR